MLLTKSACEFTFFGDILCALLVSGDPKWEVVRVIGGLMTPVYPTEQDCLHEKGAVLQ